MPSLPDLEAATLENDIDRHKVDFLRSVLPSAGRAVEVGCGSARLLARIGLASSLDLCGVDTSSEALAVAAGTARMIGKPIALVMASGERLPFPKGTFDLLLSGGLLEHFANPQTLMSEMVRVLRPGGVFYADVVPRKFSLYRARESIRMLRSPWLMPGVFETTHGPAYYKRTLEELGCNRVTIESCGVYPWIGARQFRKFSKVLDGTSLARWFGWYFMVRARRT